MNQSNKALSDLAEMFAWCDGGKKVDFRHKGFAKEAFVLVTNHIKELPSMQMDKVPSGGEFNADGWANYGRALGRNELRQQILKEMGE